MEGINHLAVLASSFFILVLGMIWYSPALFYKAWIKENSLSEEELQEQNHIKVYGLTLFLAIIMCYNLAFFLADGSTDIWWGTTAGFLTGFWAAGMFTVVALFEQKQVKYILINGGFMLVYSTISGLILGVWR